MFECWFKKSAKELRVDKKLEEDQKRIASCQHEMENVKTDIEKDWVGSEGIIYRGTVFTIIRCKKACGFTSRIYS